MQTTPPIPHEVRPSQSLHSKSTHKDFKHAQFDVPYYSVLCEEISFPALAEAHALLTYALNVGQSNEEETKVYANQDIIAKNRRQAFATTAMIYGVDPDIMVKFWPIIDVTLAHLSLKPITTTDDRQSSTPVLNYHDASSYGDGIINEMGKLII